MPRKSQQPNKVRLRRTRSDIREALLESALIEFGAKGFDGASTRAIASRVQAHQPQINYHFESKTALWTAAVDYLFGLLREAIYGVIPAQLAGVDVPELAAAFADGIRGFVRFAAEHPELHQIMVHEGTAPSDRLTWLIATHIKTFFNDILYYVLIGAASLPYVNAAEVRLLTGRNPDDPTWINAHADGLVSILLPGLAAL